MMYFGILVQKKFANFEMEKLIRIEKMIRG